MIGHSLGRMESSTLYIMIGHSLGRMESSTLYIMIGHSLGCNGIQNKDVPPNTMESRVKKFTPHCICICRRRGASIRIVDITDVRVTDTEVLEYHARFQGGRKGWLSAADLRTNISRMPPDERTKITHTQRELDRGIDTRPPSTATPNTAPAWGMATAPPRGATHGPARTHMPNQVAATKASAPLRPSSCASSTRCTRKAEKTGETKKGAAATANAAQEPGTNAAQEPGTNAAQEPGTNAEDRREAAAVLTAAGVKLAHVRSAKKDYSPSGAGYGASARKQVTPTPQPGDQRSIDTAAAAAGKWWWWG